MFFNVFLFLLRGEQRKSATLAGVESGVTETKDNPGGDKAGRLSKVTLQLAGESMATSILKRERSVA